MSAEQRALSIQQPWAWLIVNGYKDIENRNWPTRFRGRFFVHAGKTVDTLAVAWLRKNAAAILPAGVTVPETFETGGIVGESELTACVTDHPSRWFEGSHGFVLANSKPLPFRACRGMLGFFAPTPLGERTT